MPAASETLTSSFTSLNPLWAGLSVIAAIGGPWEYLISHTWAGRAILIGTLAVSGAVGSVLLPRLRSHTLLTMAVVLAEPGAMARLALSLPG
jgi:hypothetical protein